MCRCKFAKKTVSVFLIILMCIFFIQGCRGNTSSNAGDGDIVGVSEQEISEEYEVLPCFLNDISGVDFVEAAIAEDRYYVIHASLDQAEGICLSSFDINGENKKTVDLNVGKNSIVPFGSASPNGNYNYIEMKFNDNDRDAMCELVSIAGDGSEKWRTQIETGSDYLVDGILSLEKVTAILSGNHVLLYNNVDGVLFKDISVPEKNFYGNLCTSRSGEALLVGTGEKGFSIYHIDLEKFRIEDVGYSGEELGEGKIVSGGRGYDLISILDNTIYGICLDGSKPEEIISLDHSDLVFDYIIGCASLSENTFLVIGGIGENNSKVSLLKKIDATTIQGKDILTLGCTYADSTLRQAVADYNRTNKYFQIQIKEYPYDDEGSSSFNTEIAAGNIPDLIAVSDDMPIESYVSKRLFENIDSWFTNDKEIARIKFLENILDAAKVDGKMFFVTPSFGVVGLMGKKSVFGNSAGISVSQLEDIMNSNGINYETVLGTQNSNVALNLALYCSMDQFVDWKSGVCRFDSEEFKDLLEFSNKFPREINSESSDYEQEEAWIRSDKQLLKEVGLYSFDDYLMERYGYIGEEVAFMGYPGEGNTGPSISYNLSLAMSATSDEKEACWDFMKNLYMDSYQMNIEDGFPVNLDVLNERATRQIQAATNSHVDGKEGKPNTSGYISVGGEDVEIPLLTQTNYDEIMRIITSIDSKAYMDSSLKTIIQEEAGAFFAGQKTVEETADIIQKRASIYINEQK